MFLVYLSALRAIKKLIVLPFSTSLLIAFEESSMSLYDMCWDILSNTTTFLWLHPMKLPDRIIEAFLSLVSSTALISLVNKEKSFVTAFQLLLVLLILGVETRRVSDRVQITPEIISEPTSDKDTKDFDNSLEDRLYNMLTEANETNSDFLKNTTLLNLQSNSTFKRYVWKRHSEQSSNIPTELFETAVLSQHEKMNDMFISIGFVSYTNRHARFGRNLLFVSGPALLTKQDEKHTTEFDDDYNVKPSWISMSEIDICTHALMCIYIYGRE